MLKFIIIIIKWHLIRRESAFEGNYELPRGELVRPPSPSSSMWSKLGSGWRPPLPLHRALLSSEVDRCSLIRMIWNAGVEGATID